MTAPGMLSRKQGSARQTHRDAWLITAILAVGFALRLLFLLKLRGTPLFDQLFSDSRIYADIAALLASGGSPERAWFMSPLYPWLLSLFMRITEDYLLWIRIVQILLGCATVYIVWRLGCMLFDRWTGLLAAVFTATAVQLIYYENQILIDASLAFFVTAGLYALLLAIRDGQGRHWALSGLLFGLAVVTRASVIAFLPVFLISWMFRARSGSISFRGPLLWTAALLLCLLPTAIHNHSAEGVFQPVTSSFGLNLYAGNNEQAMGFYRMPEPVDLYVDANGHAWVERQTGQDMNSAEVSAWWRDRALAWMKEHPGELLLLLFRKALLFFNAGDIDQLGMSMDFVQEEYGRILALPMWTFPLLLILSFAGIGMAIRRKGGDWPLLLFFFTYVLTTVLFFVSGRLRLPVLPLLHVYAAFAVMTLAALLRGTVAWRTGLPLLPGAVIAGLVLALQPSIDQRFEQEHLKLGKIEFEAGRYANAAERFERSLEQRITLDGHINLANANAAQGKYREASSAYREALGLDSTSALAWFNYGNMWMQRNDAPRAHACWTRAVRHDPYMPAARRNLGLLLLQAGRGDEAEEHFTVYFDIERNEIDKAAFESDLERIRALIRKNEPFSNEH